MRHFHKKIIWHSNDYLGFAEDRNIAQAAQELMIRYSAGDGSVTQADAVSELYCLLNARLIRLLDKKRVLVFPSGYTANLGTILSLLRDDDLILFDLEAGAGIINGCKLSGKAYLPFKHNDLEDLEQRLRRYSRLFNRIIVVVESVYTTNGDNCPLERVLELKDRHRFRLYVDEGNTFWIHGDHGGGYCNASGISDRVDYIGGVLPGAATAIGGFVACNEELSDLTNLSIMSGMQKKVVPPYDLSVAIASLAAIQHSGGLMRKIHENSRYFRYRLSEAGFNTGTGEGPIVPVYIPDNDALSTIGKSLYRNNIFPSVITYPEVKLDQGRLRFMVTVNHDREDIDWTIRMLIVAAEKYLGAIVP